MSSAAFFGAMQSAGVPAKKLLLDMLGVMPATTFAFRKLTKDYTGPCCTVKRSTDNTTMNIGFDSQGELDLAVLTAFCGAGNGGVTMVYDQSGHGRNWIPTKDSALPKIYKAGAPILLHGHVVMEALISTDSMKLSDTSGVLQGVAAGTVVSVFQPSSTVNGNALFVSINGATADRESLGIYNNAYSMTTRIADSGSGAQLLRSSVAAGTTAILIGSGNYASGNHAQNMSLVYRQNTQVSGALFGSGNMVNTAPGSVQVPRGLVGLIGDQLIFNQSLSSQLQALVLALGLDWLA